MIHYIIAAGIGAFLGSQSKKSKKSYAHGGKITDSEVWQHGEIVDDWMSDVGGSNESRDNVIEYEGQLYLVITNLDQDMLLTPTKLAFHWAEMDDYYGQNDYYAKGGKIATLWKIPIEKGTGEPTGKPILMKKGTKRAVKMWLNKNWKNKDSVKDGWVKDGWSGVQEWHGDATVEEVAKYNGSTYAKGGKTRKKRKN